MSYLKRLDRAFEGAPCLPLYQGSRYVLFSDCHRGCGNSNDNFLKNQHLFDAALQYYYRRGFSYIELGDGDELWENRSLRQIINIHNHVFWLFSQFYKSGRLHLLYGNHDMVKKYHRYRKASCSSYLCPVSQCNQPLFPDLCFYQGIILKDCHGTQDVYLTHGHQADFLNSVLWRLSRFLVRFVWSPFEHFGLTDPTSAARNYTVRDRSERRLDHYAQKRHLLLITGHTHRPRLNPEVSSCFNTGSCVHPQCITCMEIENRMLTLVKWTLNTRTDMSLYVASEILVGPIKIDEITT